MMKIIILSLAVSLVVGVHPKTENVERASSEPEPFIDIFPPKYYPGEILNKIEFTKIDQALNEVMKSGDLLHDRRCALGVANEGTAKLSNPQMALTSGDTHAAIPPEVTNGQTSLNLFYKSKGTLTGSAGAMSYDIEGTNHKVVIFWHVPFDFNIVRVKFQMKVYTKNVAMSKDLVWHLEYNSGSLSANTWHEKTEYGVKMRGHVTDNGHSKLIVWVNADNFDPNGGYGLFTDCKYHPGRIRKMCTQECYGGGWCWTDKKCGQASECAGRHTCSGRC